MNIDLETISEAMIEFLEDKIQVLKNCKLSKDERIAISKEMSRIIRKFQELQCVCIEDE